MKSGGKSGPKQTNWNNCSFDFSSSAVHPERSIGNCFPWLRGGWSGPKLKQTNGVETFITIDNINARYSHIQPAHKHSSPHHRSALLHINYLGRSLSSCCPVCCSYCSPPPCSLPQPPPQLAGPASLGVVWTEPACAAKLSLMSLQTRQVRQHPPSSFTSLPLALPDQAAATWHQSAGVGGRGTPCWTLPTCQSK